MTYDIFEQGGHGSIHTTSQKGDQEAILEQLIYGR